MCNIDALVRLQSRYMCHYEIAPIRSKTRALHSHGNSSLRNCSKILCSSPFILMELEIVPASSVHNAFYPSIRLHGGEEGG